MVFHDLPLLLIGLEMTRVTLKANGQVLKAAVWQRMSNNVLPQTRNPHLGLLFEKGR